jgi:hypothetical protein
VSSVTNVTLFIRPDDDGANPIADNANELYAGGVGVGAWVPVPMNQRVMPTGNVNNDPNINFFMLPTAIADEYWAKVIGYTNVLLDYYVQAVDARGNTNRSDIQHVWVGAGDTNGGGGGGATNGCSGRVCVAPTPTNNLPVTISYDASSGNMPSANPVYLHLGWNNWGTVVNPDAPMTFNAPSNRWQITVNVPLNAVQLDCVFNNGSGTWDNNSGADWHFAVQANSTPQPPATPTGLTASAVQSNQINLSWNAATGAAGYLVSRGGAPLAGTPGTTFSDTGPQPGQNYCYTVTATNAVGSSGVSSNACATTPTGVITNYPPFVMDGIADFAGYLLSTNGPRLYAALRGNTLYLACQAAVGGSANDHFIFVTDSLLGSASVAAPWAKSGLIAVAASKPFISAESQNSYIVWNHAPAGSLVLKAALPSGVMEGTIDLAAAFGGLPPAVYVAACAYATADSGLLLSIAPTGSGPDLDPGEFLALPTIAFQDANGDGLYDRLDPNLGFRIESVVSHGTGLRFSYASQPGRTYRVLYRDVLTNSWTVLTGSTQSAAGLQTTLSITNTPGTPQRFYRVELLP